MNATNNGSADLGHRLLQLGVALFLIGLFTGFAMPMYANLRMGLASHLEGVMNGMFLIGMGLMWPRLRLGSTARGATFGLAIYGSVANWLTTLLAAIWGAGGKMMPIAGKGFIGSEAQEGLFAILLLSLSFAMIAVCVLLLVGLRGGGARQ